MGTAVYQDSRGNAWSEDRLALWFTPDAIRDHFEGSVPLDGISDAELVDIAVSVLEGDALYETFDRLLADALVVHHPELADAL
jgi:hypothetical protein